MSATVRRVVLVGLACLLLALSAAVWPGCHRAGSAPAWQAPVDLSAAGDVDWGPQVAVDARGNAVAVWTSDDSRGGTTCVQGAVRPAGGVWQAPVELSVAGARASGPQVAVDVRGNAVAVWERHTARTSVVQAAVRPVGGSWKAPANLSEPGADAIAPQVAFDQRGDAIVVWARSRAGNTIVQSAALAAGGRWQAAVDIAESSAASQPAFAAPRVAVDAQGNAVAVWTNVSVGNMGVVQGAVRPTGRAWQAPVDLSAAGQRSFDANVAVDARGNAVAVWLDFTHSIVQGAVRPGGEDWQAAMNISTPGQNAGGADVAVDPHGNATVVWTRFGGIASAVRPEGGVWQAPVDISGGQETFGARVAVDARGNAFAVWMGSDGGIVQGVVRDAGGDWQRSVDIARAAYAVEASGAQIAVAVSLRGDAVAVWSRDIGGRSIVQAAVQRLDD